MNDKKTLSLYAVFAIILAAFVLIYFIIPFEKTATANVMLVFGIASILAACIFTHIGIVNGNTLKSKVYGFSILRIGIGYMSVQLVLSVIIIIADAAKKIPAWPGTVISIILLAAALIGVIGAENARDIITDIDSKTEQRAQDFEEINKKSKM